jgi:hypothetical protein
MTVALWALVAMGVWWIASREQDAKMKMLQAKTDVARVVFDTARTVAIQTRYVSRAASKREREAQMALTARLEALSDSVAEYREIVADGTVTADTLRAALAKAADQLDTLRGISLAYTQAVDSLKAAYAEERRAATVALEKAEGVIALQDTMLKEQRFGRFNRATVQAVAIGFGIGLIAGLLR